MVNFEDSFAVLGLPTDEDLFLPSGDSDHEEEDKGGVSGHRLRPKRIPRKTIEKRKQEDIALDAMTGMTPSIIRGRWVVILVLCACATGMALATFQFISRNEKDEFQSTARSVGRELLDSTEDEVLQTLALLHSASTSTTSLVRALDENFPFVTVPDFQEKANEILINGLAEAVGFAPLVSEGQRSQWELYSVDNQAWLEDYRQEQAAVFSLERISPTIVDGSSDIVAPFLVPFWQMYPVSAETAELVNVDMITNTEDVVSRAILESVTRNVDILTSIENSTLTPLTRVPRSSFMVSPVVNGAASSENTIGAILWATLKWDFIFSGKLPDETGRMLVEVQNDCGVRMSYSVKGQESTFLGNDLLHDDEFNDLAVRRSPFGTNSSTCVFSVTAYPTQAFKTLYITDAPWVYSAAVICVFFVAASVFAFYDQSLHRRQEQVLQNARKTSAIVAELFPKNVQSRIIEEKSAHGSSGYGNGGLAPKTEMRNLIGGGGDEKSRLQDYKGKPIADLFPETTIIFADIVGFTAWSSTREPTQVFTLLEGIYAEFDRIAARRRVFKVETVGDCYVAVCGLPDPRKDHALVMAKFARDCLYRFKTLTKELEKELGPDTGDLGIRIGLHSGPTVAGVLRGQRSRFQLFGDSVNTTARMESTGLCNRIHLSQETADLLQAAGKSHWLQMRKERVKAKGKGELQTYWLATGGGESGYEMTENHSESHAAMENPEITEARLAENPIQLSEKQIRLVEWNAEILCRKLEDIVARREAVGSVPDSGTHVDQVERIQSENCFGMALDEVVEIIELPTYRQTNDLDKPPSSLNENVTEQLLDYVQTLASMYHQNAFHNFEHASHVTMSVNKLLSRIIAPDLEHDGRRDLKWRLHDHTYGITSDPLTQFAVTLSALMHDVDHSGVPNAQLVKEHTSLASAYNNKSVAEQNSVDIAWDLLMEDCYKDLRRTIYCNEVEFKRFRQLIVNTVLATDIMDRDLGNLRKKRWSKAFTEKPREEPAKNCVNRKATIVIEHLIQASDVAHTMQHWHVYRKWNARLFREMYFAYQEGRADTDPCENWYKGELGFFDFYIIPLAKKLKNCGVFGVSSDEYLTYALQNRAEWEAKGKEVVAELIRSVRGRDDSEYDGDKSFIPQDLIMGEPVAKRMSLSHESLGFYVNEEDKED